MIGSWAGELGQTQFLPSHYFKHAVDYDGDGRRNLMRSVPDVIASTANFIVFLGWQRGQPWLQEVRVPANLAWDQADLAIQHPRSKWAGWGVTVGGRQAAAVRRPAGLAAAADGAASGRRSSPTRTSRSISKWNQSLNYCITAAHLADAPRRRPAVRPRQRRGAGMVLPADEGAAAAAGAARLRGRRGRRQARRGDARRRQGRADEARPARRFLPHARSWSSACAAGR